ncbi:MAG: acyl-CoA dehydrogenase family protein [Desulfobacteraceae bacterium]|jgi:alkylation response protein AidB-like acyl-CoA dehydrogenase
MITRKEIKSYLSQEPLFDDITCSLKATTRQPKAMIAETKKVIAMARKFSDEVLRPYSLEMDRNMQQDPNYLPWDMVKKANEWGFFTLWIPKLFGGHGYNIPSLSYFMEETGSVCLGLSNLICVHYLAVSTIFGSWNLKMINKICRFVAEGERTGNPCLLSTAITEPGAGTDVEEVELVDHSNVACHAKKVDGGYLISGSKIFISSGHVSTWHMVICYTDLDKPSENMIILAVKTGTKGFSFGRVEHKMGVKACPASELIFDNCFVPDDMVLCGPDDGARQKRGARNTNAQILDYVLAGSRAGVGAWGAGAARGAYETALDFALKTEVNGKLLVNHEWAQAMLAEMYKNLSIARLAYTESNYANGLYGLFKSIQFKPVYYYLKFVPKAVFDKFAGVFLDLYQTTWMFRKIQLDWQTDEECHRTAGWGSLAKFSGTDLGMRNCQMALELMGQSGLRHDNRAEKMLRDAKLLQIYEGTNQLNRLNMFKCLVARNYPQIKVFEKE